MKKLLVLSGIPASHWGTGRMMSHLESEVRRRRLPCTVLGRPDRPPLRRRRIVSALYHWSAYQLARGSYAVRQVNALRHVSRPLLLLHPQTLGFELALEIIAARRAPLALFLLDSSFFCIRSYNHVAGEAAACTRCLGGRFTEAARMGCVPFPKPDPAAMKFVDALRQPVKDGRVVLIAQTDTQAELARRHFGLAEQPAVAGLWTADWDAVLRGSAAAAPVASGKWDVVFHGFDLPAKGPVWLEAVAERLPGRRFLFPFPRPPGRSTPQNCDYVPMTWESGLENAIRAAPLSVVPSLWSAPIEGSLVKSIAASRAVAVVSNTSAYANELPDGLVLRLPTEPAAAAAAVSAALESDWSPAAEGKTAWLENLSRQRDRFVERLLSAVPGSPVGSSAP